MATRGQRLRSKFGEHPERVEGALMALSDLPPLYTSASVNGVVRRSDYSLTFL